ncbi:MAG: 50S ribosomal protein L25 [Deltaproteobacteria bacterium]|nr:50S ribosomal protein L25 [Deltaproteobacteria bacterium]
MSTILKAAPREAGQNPGRLRKEGRLPAVFYGPGQDQALSLTLDYKEFKTALTTSPGNRSLYTLTIEGESPQPVLLKDFQMNPLTRKAIHADFYKLDPDRPVRLKLPVVLTGKPQGVEKGGQLQPGLREVEVSVRPDQAPAELVVDVSELKLGQSLHLSQIAVPGEVRLLFTADLPVATVMVPKGLKAEAEAEASGAEAAPAAPPKAAPAAKAKGKK